MVFAASLFSIEDVFCKFDKFAASIGLVIGVGWASAIFPFSRFLFSIEVSLFNVDKISLLVRGLSN
ncbi:MAG: hypothetical protein NTZ20_04665 [Candidatus Levybacteria bacterium]|nr:hypothetical protein [Candidatus Levybacteria bacterium]